MRLRFYCDLSFPYFKGDLFGYFTQFRKGFNAQHHEPIEGFQEYCHTPIFVKILDLHIFSNAILF